MKIRFGAFGLLVLVCMMWTAIAAAEKPRFGDTLTFALGGMKHKGTALFASTNEDAPVDKLSFRDLGMSDDTTVVWGDFAWQFLERWRFSLNYSSFDANGFTSASESGNFGAIDWEIGASLTSDFNMKLYIADVTWDFIKTDNAHLGIGVGLHAADLDFDLTAEVDIDLGQGMFETQIRTEQASVLAPLPNVTLTGGTMIGDNVYLGGTLGYFSLNYDKYDGELTSIRGGVEWRPVKRFGLGVAYQYVDINVKVDESSSQELYDLEFKGPILFVSVGF